MAYRTSVCIIFIIFLLALKGLEAKRRKTKVVGKCLDKRGNLKCNSKQVCVNKNKLCQPYDESPKCKCKKLKVKGCEDMLGRSVCNYNEVCLVKKSGKTCKNKYSKNCKCIVQEVTTPSLPPPTLGAGCYVYVDRLRIPLPFDNKYYKIDGLPCKECKCVPRYPHIVDYCRNKAGCNAALHLVFEDS